MNPEAERQQALMAALLGAESSSDHLRRHLSPLPMPRFERGLQAYQANAGASAERTLASTFPTVQALVGEESFAALARVFWRRHPPVRGDLACFGEGLPAFIADSEQLSDVPYLADVARLEWLVAAAERAADAEPELDTLQWLATCEPAELRLEFLPGTAVLPSDHPILSVWLAHRPGEDAEAHWAQARQAAAVGQGDTVVVGRAGWRATVHALAPGARRWMQSLLRGDSLATALAAADDAFAFEPWLGEALQRGWLARAVRIA